MRNAPRVWLDRELTAFGATLPSGAVVLDAGAGNQKYKPKFAHCNYEAADFEKVDKEYARSSYVCDLRKVPVEDGRFDAIVFTMVMEHLPEPAAALREFYRILKPGGMLFYAAPFWYEEHEQPYDFYRYTQFGVRHLMESSGFKVRELRWLDGYMASVAHQLRRMGRALPRTPAGYGGGIGGLFRFAAFNLMRFPCFALAILAAQSDVACRYTKKGYPMNYLAILEKPPAFRRA